MDEGESLCMSDSHVLVYAGSLVLMQRHTQRPVSGVAQLCMSAAHSYVAVCGISIAVVSPAKETPP